MKQDACKAARLVACLNDDLSDQDLGKLTKHLDACDDCRRQIEQLAASEDRWDDVRNFLSRDEIEGIDFHEDTVSETSLPFPIRQVLSMLDPTDEPHSMGRLGGHEVVGVVGSGAMGVVLKAFDRALDRVVALKVMTPTLAACSTARFRFAREAKAAAGVLHPNVITIHGVSADRELPYLVMPCITGPSLQQRMDRQGPLELVEVLRIGSQISAGLVAAHQKGLIHRDIKPSNIMLDEGVETAMITDFGLARTLDDATMTRTGAITGTPEYMSPEQARGDSVDCASDIFSLGSLLYALCTGRRPFQAKTTFGVLRKITDEEPTPIRELRPEIPKWLCELIRNMHAKSPDERLSSAEAHEQLVACLAHVYQPDRNALPETLVKQDSLTRSQLSRTLFPGAIAMSTLALIVTLFAIAPPGNVFVGPVGEDFSKPTINGASDGTGDGVSEDVSDRVAVSRNDPAVFKIHRESFPDQNRKGKLVVDINRGFIELEGHGGNEVVIEVLTPPQFRSADNEGSEFQRLFTPKYDFDINVDDNSIAFDDYNQDYPLNLRIKVPYTTDLSLDSYMDGYIIAKNVTGVLHTHSEHSDITLLKIAGSATAYSRNGNLKIDFLEVAADAKLDFESYNGAIDLSLPETTRVSTAIASGASDCLTAFRIKPAESHDCSDLMVPTVRRNIDEYQFGKINGGGIPLRIENARGAIRIRKRSSADTAKSP